jgi:histidinol-phosphate aminotransferase
MRSPKNLVRPLVRKLHPYVPGEQPKIQGLIKLNTNENPYPPAPQVLRAVRKAADARLRLYPNPSSQALRAALARLHQCAPENIFVGNGSDEVLALAVRAFVEPAAGAKNDARCSVQYFTPSYSLYPVLAETHGAKTHPVPLAPDFSLPSLAELRRKKTWMFDAALTLVTTPNAPSGRGYRTADIDALCRAQKGVVLLDEAYVDFADEHAMELSLQHPHVLVARTFSKAYSLCFQRVGYCAGHPELIGALDKIRDSYNVNGLGQAAALETLQHLDYYRRNFKKICATRARLARELALLGFHVLPSQANFLLARPPGAPAEKWCAELRDRKVLVRWFSYPEVRDYLRITIGTDEETDQLLRAVRAVSKNR